MQLEIDVVEEQNELGRILLYSPIPYSENSLHVYASLLACTVLYRGDSAVAAATT